MNLIQTFFLCIALVFSMSSYARHDPIEPSAAQRYNHSQLPLSKESAAKLIRSESNGKVLSVDSKQRNGQQIFKVKVLYPNGRIKIYRLDAKTGRKLRISTGQ